MFNYNKEKKRIEIVFGKLKFQCSLNIERILVKSLLPLLKLVDFIIPKNNKKIIFNSNPDFSDNAYAFYKYVQNNHSKDYDCIWIVNPDCTDVLRQTTKNYDWYTLKGIHHLLTSKYIVITHTNRFINFVSGAHTIINLWHGMPLTSLGLNEKIISKKAKNRYKFVGKNAYCFATSDIFKLSLLTTFESPYSKIFITGQPRTDLIWDNKNAEKIEKIFNFKNYNKTIFYMPTYKENQNIRIRQIKHNYENIFYFNDYNEKEFIDYLEKNNILFIMKPHPFDENFYSNIQDTLPKSNNFKLIFNKDFANSEIYSYEIFKYIDLMISDFSSVTIDYLILNKPVIYLNNLTEEYNEQRGMILPDNTEMFMPGTKVDNFTTFIDELSKNLYNDTHKKEREKTLPLLHKYCDNKSCERIFEIMRKL